MRRLFAAVLLTTIPAAPSQGAVEPFQPFQQRAYRLVNGVAFEGNEDAMYFALYTRDVLAERGQPDSTAPITNIYVSQRSASGWSNPMLAPFSNSFTDYEPALSVDGNVMLFNSKRPYADGRTPTRNDLWIVERRSGVWGAPHALPDINTFELEESYATIDSARRVIFVRGPVVEGGDDFDLYEFRLRGDGVPTEPMQLPFSGPEYGEGDPQLARDGSFVIFTRWDEKAGWQQSCDLWISFRGSVGWTIPVPLVELNTTAPDYAPAISPDGLTLYYRAGGRYLRRPIGPVLDSARARTQ